MGGFSYKDIYIEDGRRVLEVDIFKKKLGITDERFEEISNALLNS
jgi:hypothetical protein